MVRYAKQVHCRHLLLRNARAVHGRSIRQCGKLHKKFALRGTFAGTANAGQELSF